MTIKNLSAIILCILMFLLHDRITQPQYAQGADFLSDYMAGTGISASEWNPEDPWSVKGYWMCDPYDLSCAVRPSEKARFQIMAAGYQPGRACFANPFCLDAYATLVQLTIRLGRAPAISEIIYMIAGTEYFAYVDYPVNGVQTITVRRAGQEALARNYYAACGLNSCQGDELYRFLAAYQPWYGIPYKTEGSYSAAARAIELLDTGLNNDFLGTGYLLWEDINQILDLAYASHVDQNWIAGRNGDRPWSWFGPFRSSSARMPITYGLSAENTALLGANTGDGFLLLMFTGDQDLNFNLAYLTP